MPFSSVPRQIGPYVVEQVLSTTRAGALLHAQERPGGRRQTLLLLDPDLGRWPQRLRDRRVLPPHPHSCGLAAEAPARLRQGDRSFYYVGTEPLCGWTALDEIVRDGVIAPPARALRLCAEAADALCCAHECGLYHGHLEPGCLFIQTLAPEDPGRVKLLGVGLRVPAGEASRAALYRDPATRGGRPRGRAQWMAADVYALGAVLWTLLAGGSWTGAPPAVSRAALAHFALAPLAEDAPGLSEVVLRALHPVPRLRYRSMAELRDDLRALVRAGVRRPAPVPAIWPLLSRGRGASAQA